MRWWIGWPGMTEWACFLVSTRITADSVRERCEVLNCTAVCMALKIEFVLVNVSYQRVSCLSLDDGILRERNPR